MKRRLYLTGTDGTINLLERCDRRRYLLRDAPRLFGTKGVFIFNRSINFTLYLDISVYLDA